MKGSNRELGFETRAIHAGQEPDETTGAVNVPVYLSSTYVQSSPGVHKGYDYSRTANPTLSASSASKPTISAIFSDAQCTRSTSWFRSSRKGRVLADTLESQHRAQSGMNEDN